MPDSILSKNPEISTNFSSVVRPPTPELKNEIKPSGVIPIRCLTVL